MSDDPPATLPPWLLLSVQAPPPGEEILLVEAMRSVGARAVERDGARYEAILPPPRDLDSLLREAEAVIRASTSLRNPRVSYRWQSHTAWGAEWGRTLEPRRVGRRIVVTGTGSEPPSGEGDVVIRLVPGVGFGTAEHGSTRGCLRLLEETVASGDRIADVGSGSGILAIAAALLGSRRVLALELDPYACAAARLNVEENGVGDRVELREEEVGSGTLVGEQPFDGIVANLQSSILLPLLPGLSRAISPGKWLIVSGIFRGERDRLVAAARESGLELELELVEDGWWSGRFRRSERAEDASIRSPGTFPR